MTAETELEIRNK